MSQLHEAIKMVVDEYVSNTPQTALMYGTVTKENPLEVTFDQRLIVSDKFLTVAQHLTDYEIECEITTDALSGFYGTDETTHAVFVSPKGFQDGKIKLLNHLKQGDKVICIRLNKQNQYAIIDRIGEKANG